MLIKFFPNGKGGGAGPVNYLTATTVLAYDENRDLIRDESGNPVQVTRDPLPEVLRGDAASMTDLIDICSHKWSYRAGVISFAKDDAPSEDTQQDMIDRFEELAFAGLDKDQYACLWVRHSHEDRVELHFCTPRMELDSGRSLNIAPPGYERAFDSLRDLMNKTHGWADPMDVERVQEAKTIAEAPHRAAGREELHDWIRYQISEGLITDRAEMIDVLISAGFEVPRAGKNYLTIKDPETDERWRMKGEVFHEEWTTETAIEREAERGLGTNEGRERRLGRNTVAELQERFEGHCRKRTGYNQDRYRRVSVAPEETPYAAEREHREAEPKGDVLADDGSYLPDHQRLGDTLDHSGLVEAQHALDGGAGNQATRNDVPDPDQPECDDSAMFIGGSAGELPENRKGIGDGWSDTVGARITGLRRAVGASLESIGAGINRLRGALDAGNESGAGWVEALRDRVGQVTDLIGHCLGRLDAGRSDLRTAIVQAQGQLGAGQESAETNRHTLTEEITKEEQHGISH